MTKQFVHDVFVTALEGSIDYWAEILKYHWGIKEKDGNYRDDLDGFFAEVVPRDEPDSELRIDKTTILDGVAQIIDDNIRISPDRMEKIREAARLNDAGDIDADLADCIVQAGLFGEIVYG
jgi:hypothetical protein